MKVTVPCTYSITNNLAHFHQSICAKLECTFDTEAAVQFHQENSLLDLLLNVDVLCYSLNAKDQAINLLTQKLGTFEVGWYAHFYQGQMNNY
jgi:hypothetical protein